MTAPGSGLACSAIGLTDTLLRNVGGRVVLLHMPAPAVPGDAGEQLGLAIPQFQDVPVGPALLRRVRAKTGTAERPREINYELLLSASAVKQALGSLGYAAAEVLFAQAAGVIIDGLLFGITWAASAEAFGTVYCYRLGLRGTISNFV